jgi:hypothetical protein
MKIDSIEYRLGDLSDVIMNRVSGAETASPRGTEAPTRARVHRGNKLKGGGKRYRRLCPNDVYGAGLKGCAHRLKRGTAKLGELIEKEDTAMSQTYLTWAGGAPSTDETNVGNDMVWRAKRPCPEEDIFDGEPRDRVDLHNFEGLFLR